LNLPPHSTRLPEVPNQPIRRRPGTKVVLGLFLVVAVVGGAAGLIAIAAGGWQEDVLDPSATTALLPQRMVLLAVCGLVNAGCAVGMWGFRRWGIYGVVCASLVAFMVNWRIGGVPLALPGLIGLALVSIFSMALWMEFD
jgi:ascorbate-specific PTS system EIIC-type component UlaA